MYEDGDDQAYVGRASHGRPTPLVRRSYVGQEDGRGGGARHARRADAAGRADETYEDSGAYAGGQYAGDPYDGNQYAGDPYDNNPYTGDPYADGRGDDRADPYGSPRDGRPRASHARDGHPDASDDYAAYYQPKPSGRRHSRNQPAARRARPIPIRLLDGLPTPLLAAGLAALAALIALLVFLVPRCTRGGVADTADVASEEVVASAADQAGDASDNDATDDATTTGASSQPTGSLSGTPSYSTVREAVSQAAAPYGDSLAVVYIPLDDPHSGCDVNGDVQMRSASMIKTAILATFLQQVEDGAISPDDTYTIRQSDVVGGTGSLQGAVGHTYTYDQLAEHMIFESDNVATNVLINALGMQAVNAECESLGLSGTHLGRLMMTADSSAKASNYTTAEDQARIFQLIANGELVSQEQSARALGYLREQEDDEGIVAGVPKGTVVANKTGSLNTVRHDGGIVYATHPYVLVVMTQNLGESAANQAMAAISKAAWDASVQVGAA